ncbi:MAG: hypothetical protein HQK54_12490, partial [Oligoflexales bacterium]|nr:hypothetical protein [Oligoflexales bacterium]
GRGFLKLDDLKTTNQIESTFTSVKLRTNVGKGSGNKETAETMAFKLMSEAEKNCRRIRGYAEIENLPSGRLYVDGKEKWDQEGCLTSIHDFQEYIGLYLKISVVRI